MSDRAMSYAQQQEILLNKANFSSLLDGIDNAVNQYADRVAFTCLGHSVTYSQIDTQSRILASYLLDQTSLQPGDRVAIQLPNIAQYPVAAYAIWRAGLIVVNTNPLYTERELVHQFNDSGAKALIVLSDLLPMTQLVVPKTGIKYVIATHATDMIKPQGLPDAIAMSHCVSWQEAMNHRSANSLPASALRMSDVAVLQYTGGTTGVAKGAVLSHGNLYCAILQSRAAMIVAAERRGVNPEVCISPMPLYHVYGFSLNVVSVFITGGHSVLIPNPRDIDSLISAMKSFPFTAFAGLNTLFMALMAHADFDSIDYSHLDTTIAGGSALAQEVAEQWQRRTGTPILEGYGLTETCATATLNRHNDNQIGTVGTALSHMNVKLIDEHGEQVKAGEEGELCLQGPQIMQGYWQRKEATEEVMDSVGWFRTGDVATILEDGHIKIVDRLKDMILVSGFNVYPNEIENVVYSFPGVRECAAIGVKHEKTGEAVKLFVVTNDTQTTDQDIITHCRSQLTGYKVPKQIEFRDELPKSNVGKILRRELRS